MEFKELLTKRYAAKLFQPKAVPEETMQELLEMVRLAPSGLNIQPWRIKVVSDAGHQGEALGRHARRAADQELLSSSRVLRRHRLGRPDPTLGRTMKERTVPDKIWAIVMGIAAEMAREPEDELQAWIIGNVYIAATYGLLGAQALGLDSCPMTHFALRSSPHPRSAGQRRAGAAVGRGLRRRRAAAQVALPAGRHPDLEGC